MYFSPVLLVGLLAGALQHDDHDEVRTGTIVVFLRLPDTPASNTLCVDFVDALE